MHPGRRQNGRQSGREKASNTPSQRTKRRRAGFRQDLCGRQRRQPGHDRATSAGLLRRACSSSIRSMIRANCRSDRSCTSRPKAPRAKRNQTNEQSERLYAPEERLHLVSRCPRPARHRHRHSFQHRRFCARQPGRRLFFPPPARRLARDGSGRLHRRRRWSITISGSAPGGFGLPSRSSGWRSAFSRPSGTRSTAPGAGWLFTTSPVSPRSSPRLRPSSFSPSGFRVTKPRATSSGAVSSFRWRSLACSSRLIITEVDLGTTVLIGATTFVVMFIAGTNLALLGTLFVRRNRRDSFPRHPHRGTQ